MALVLKDRVRETTTTAGTGTVTLGGAVGGYQSFSVIGNGNTTYYTIYDANTGDWEVGIGTYTSSGTTLSRDTILESSNAGSAVPFAAGSKDVFVTYPAERSVYLDSAGSYPVQSTFNTLTATTATLTNGTISTTPSSATDIANKSYVDTLVSSGITYHAPVKYEVPNTTGNLNAVYNQPGGPGVGVGATLTNNGTKAAFAPDGPTAQVGDRILIYSQTNAFENGVYEVTTVGTPDPGGTNWVLTRTSDADTYGLKSPTSLGNGDAFFVTSGNTGAGETYVCNTTGVITFGTTNITFAQVSSAQVYSAGTGLTLSPATTFNIATTGVAANTYGSASAVPVFAVNAQGQITSVTNTSIAISGAAVTGNISGQAGSVANALTAGSYLTSTGTYDGSVARTFSVDATSANTASKVVARDSSGDFSAGTITATLSGSATSATTATNLAGGAANQIPYQTGAGATSFTAAPTSSGQVLSWNGSAYTWVAGTISGVSLGSNLNALTLGSYLTGTSYNGSANITAAVDATSANTASKVVARDASGNFSAGTITATLSGSATSAGSVTNSLTFNNSGTGEASGATFNGSAAKTISYNTVGASPTAGSASITTLGTISTGTWQGTAIGVAYGGTGLTATPTNGQIDIGNGSGFTRATITGTSNQITVTNGAGTITLSTPQSINTTASVQFGSFGVGTAASGTTGEIRATNNVTAYYSDDRLKTRLGKIENALDKVDQLNGFYYEANETAQALGYKVKREVGVSAQDVQAVMPEIVTAAPIDEKYMTIYYERLVPLLIEAIKELRAEVKALKEA